MKRILFILPSLKVGGLEKVQVTLANALAERGYDVTVMALNPGTDLLPQLDKRVKYIHKPYKQHKIMKRIPYIRNKFYDDGMWETRASAKTLYKYYVGNEKYDVEVAFFRGLPIKIISGSTNNDSVKLAWVHNDFRRATGYTNNFKDITAARKAYSLFKRVICVSNEAKEGFKAVIGDIHNLETIYNLLPINRIVEQAEECMVLPASTAKLKIIIVGRLIDSAKGQIRLVKVVSQLQKEGYDISLTIVGAGKDEELIKDTINGLNAASFVFMTGNQNNPYPFISNSDLLVCASYYEGFNLTVAEALILGVPVLSTDCAGPNEILEHGKYGVIVENSEKGLYDGIKDLLDTPEKIDYFKKKAMDRIAFFNEEKILDQIIRLMGKNG